MLKTKQKTQPQPKAMKGAIALMNGFTMAFGTAWANGDPAGIAETFAADGVRIIGGAQEAFNGRAGNSCFIW